jgi:hypothetical protein
MGIASIRDLLSGSGFNQSGIRKSITAAMVVECANRNLKGYLPGDRAYDVVAISYRNEILRLRVKNAAARYLLKRISDELLEKIRVSYPTVKILRITTFLSKEPSRYELP